MGGSAIPDEKNTVILTSFPQKTTFPVPSSRPRNRSSPVFPLEKDRFFPVREPRLFFAHSGLRPDAGLPGKLQITLFLRKTAGH